MFGSTDLYAALNVSAVTDLLDEYRSAPALFSDNLIPQDCDAEKTINFYMAGMFLGGMSYEQHEYNINCRAKTNNESREIAEAVFNELNRSFNGESFFLCNVMPTIGPADDTDNYNTPILVYIKKR